MYTIKKTQKSCLHVDSRSSESFMVEKEQSLAIEKKRFAVGCRQSVVVKIQNEKPFFSSKIAAKDVVNNQVYCRLPEWASHDKPNHPPAVTRTVDYLHVLFYRHSGSSRMIEGSHRASLPSFFCGSGVSHSWWCGMQC